MSKSSFRQTVCPALALAVMACSYKRENAVKETLAFAQRAPFTIQEREGPLTIGVDDSALGSYNQVFKYFDPADSTRTSAYERLPGDILTLLPITRVEEVSSRKLAADTVQVTAVFERPDTAFFEKAFRNLIDSHDGDRTMHGIAAGFRELLVRARRELQTRDTTYFWVLDGPRIVRIETASAKRESLAQKSRGVAQLRELSTLVKSATFSGLRARDFSALASSGTDKGGGAIQGFVELGGQGWIGNHDQSHLSVECEARNGEQVTKTESIEQLDKLVFEQGKVLCPWLAGLGGAKEWNRIKPRTFRVRLVGYAAGDSVIGAWFDVPGPVR